MAEIFSLKNKYFIFSSEVSFGKRLALKVVKEIFLVFSSLGQFKIKCISSSTDPEEHSLHIRASLGMLRRLPFSTSRSKVPRRNLENIALFFLQLKRLRYFAGLFRGFEFLNKVSFVSWLMCHLGFGRRHPVGFDIHRIHVYVTHTFG